MKNILVMSVMGIVGALSLASLVSTAGAADATDKMHEFPTLTRVEYVLDCMQSYDRPQRELVYKCTCAIDAIAKKMDHQEWTALLTFNNAAPIAGERGAYLRERKDIRTHVKHYRDTQEMARNACFLPEPRK